MSDPVSEFIDFMRSCGIGPEDPAEILDDDKPHRYRLAGDKPRVKNGSYALRVEPDGFAFGWCLSFKEGVTHKWHTKASRKLSPEERAAHKARAAEAKRARDEKIRAEAEAAARKAVKLWRRAKPGTTEYLNRKQIEAHGARVMGDLLVVPMWSRGAITGLQFIAADGSKRFLKGSAKDGAYSPLAAKSDDLSRIVICEGFATGGSVRQATGWPVIVAFDAGNLEPVARAMRAKYPDAEIIIAGDNDQWTKRQDGSDWNPGVEKAQKAAIAIGGARVIYPQVDPLDPTRRTDWNDIHCTDGLDAVRDALTAQPVITPPEPEYDHDYAPDYDPPEPEHETSTLLEHVRPLGRNGKVFYFFPRTAGQIMDFTGPSLANMQNLITMAPMALWFSQFGGADVSERKMASAAANALIERCNQIGIYNPEVERGVGMWVDERGPVFNSGDKVYHADGSCSPADFRSSAVYVMGARVGGLSDSPLTSKEAGELLNICLSLTWKNRQFGYVLAGWIVAAVIGGALRWRPHIVLTGEKGAGKTWVLEHIIKPALGGLYLERDGGTTEAKIRRDLGGNSRPIIMDEAESETSRDRQNMEAVLNLARKSSTGAAVGNADGLYYIRSCFCFSAINPRIIQGADLDRNTILQLVRDRRHDADARFKDLAARVISTIDKDFASRMLARCFRDLPVILQNVEVFSDVIAQREGSKRFGDQFGTLIACAFALTSNKPVTPEYAHEWCSRHDWKWAREDNDQSDSERLLDYILSCRIRYDDRGMVREGLVGGLIDRARRGGDLERDAAVTALGIHGMKLVGDGIVFACPCQPLSAMLKETSWSGSYRRALSDLDGAQPVDKVTFSPTLRARGVSVPLTLVLAEMQPDDPDEIELPFAEDF
jgi:putative DNA primase/helicase